MNFSGHKMTGAHCFIEVCNMKFAFPQPMDYSIIKTVINSTDDYPKLKTICVFHIKLKKDGTGEKTIN